MAVCLKGAQWLRCFTMLFWHLLRCQHSGVSWEAGVLHESRHGRLLNRSFMAFLSSVLPAVQLAPSISVCVSTQGL